MSLSKVNLIPATYAKEGKLLKWDCEFNADIKSTFGFDTDSDIWLRLFGKQGPWNINNYLCTSVTCNKNKLAKKSRNFFFTFLGNKNWFVQKV